MFNIDNLDFVEIDHEKVYKKNKAFVYQKYIDKNIPATDRSLIEHIRILKDFYDEYKITLVTGRPLDKKILFNMFNTIDNTYTIESIKKQWLRHNINVNINDYNINDGEFEWFVKLKKNGHSLPGSEFNNLVSIEKIMLGGHAEQTKFISIIVNGKLYDRVYLDIITKDIIYAYARRYQKTLKGFDIIDIKDNIIHFA
jgi:hypothetical protein